MSSGMSVAERESYLNEVHYAVLSVAGPDGQGPLQTVVGYLYEPGGDLIFSTGRDSRKMTHIREAGRVSLLVQTEEMPTRYVSFEGPVISEEPTKPEVHREMCVRYLGPEDGEEYYQSSKDDLDEMVTVRVRPKHWRTYFFSIGE